MFSKIKNTYYVGNIKGVGRIYQHTLIDTYSKVAFAKLYDHKNALLAVNQLIHEDQEPTVEAAYKEYGVNTEKKTEVSILNLIDEYLSNIKGNLAYNTHKNRKHDLYYFRSFAKGKRINPASFDNKLYNDFKTWLREEKKLSDNSVSCIIKTLRIYLGWLVSDRKMDVNKSYQEWDVKETYSDNIYLLQKEFNKLLKHDFSKAPDQEVVRDQFIFQYHTGLRISDLYRFRKDTHLVDGKITIDQQKNDSFVKIPLNPVSARILDKYAEFPHLPDPVYNEKIKKVCKLAGLNRMIEISIKKNGKKAHDINLYMRLYPVMMQSGRL